MIWARSYHHFLQSRTCGHRSRIFQSVSSDLSCSSGKPRYSSQGRTAALSCKLSSYRSLLQCNESVLMNFKILHRRNHSWKFNRIQWRPQWIVTAMFEEVFLYFILNLVGEQTHIRETFRWENHSSVQGIISSRTTSQTVFLVLLSSLGITVSNNSLVCWGRMLPSSSS